MDKVVLWYPGRRFGMSSYLMRDLKHLVQEFFSRNHQIIGLYYADLKIA
jgi:hypothetical protein